MKPDSPTFDVRQVAQLARLALTDDEAVRFQQQLGQVLAHVEQLKSVDVSDVEPTAYAQPVFNVFREDAIRESLPREDVTANAPKSANGLIVVTKVVE